MNLDEFVDKLSYNFELKSTIHWLIILFMPDGVRGGDRFKPYVFPLTTLFTLEEDDDTIPLIDIPCGENETLFVQGP